MGNKVNLITAVPRQTVLDVFNQKRFISQDKNDIL